MSTEGSSPSDWERFTRARLDILQNKQLDVYYQPIVRLSDGTLAGFEALMRWHHPRRGLVPPAVFIPIAERKIGRAHV